MGRKPRRLKNHQNKLLEMFFSARDLTPWQAAVYVGCGYEYAQKKFKEFEQIRFRKIHDPTFTRN